jgi:hypothetical protein
MKEEGGATFRGNGRGELGILLTIIPSGSQVGNHVVFAFQKSIIADGEPRSTQGLPPTESLSTESIC